MYRSNQLIVLFADFSLRQLLGQLVAPLLCRNPSFTAQECEILSRTNAQFKLSPCSTTFCHWLIAMLLTVVVTSALRCARSVEIQHIPLAYMRLTQILLSLSPQKTSQQSLHSIAFGTLKCLMLLLQSVISVPQSWKLLHLFRVIMHTGHPQLLQTCTYHHDYKPSSSHYMLPSVKLSPKYNQILFINVFHACSQIPFSFSFCPPEVKNCFSFLTHSL